jgi:competence protein ComFC
VWKSGLDTALSFFYPEVCQICGVERATAQDGYVGLKCREQVRMIEPPLCQCCGLPFEGAITTTFECPNCRERKLYFCWARSAVSAKGVVLDVIHRYKYQRAVWFENFLANLLIQQAKGMLSPQGWDCLTPVPLYPARRREREFNQAERLARHLSLATNIPLRDPLLRRTRPTRVQAMLDRVDRPVNVEGAFAASPGANLDGERVVLVDDVLTTGSTTSACARALLQAGASQVCVWTVARGV